MYLPLWLIVPALILMTGVIAWLIAILRGRNPLPFPDRGSRIFTAPSPKGKEAIVALLRENGIGERFRADSDAVERSIMWDGTIINCPTPEVLTKVGGAVASIGLVSADPVASAEKAATFLRSRGFQASVVLDVEPELPIAFVTTDALSGTVINFRKHIIHLPRPTPGRD